MTYIPNSQSRVEKYSSQASHSSNSSKPAPKSPKLTSKERQYLGRMAREAWEHCSAKSYGIPCDEWRSEQVSHATDGQADGIRQMRRGQFRDVKAAFLHILGKSAEAFQAASTAGEDICQHEAATHILKRECEQNGYAYPAYPNGIARNQDHSTIEQLDTAAIWRLIYTVRNRAKKKATRTPSESSLKDNGPNTPETNSKQIATSADHLAAK